MVVAGLRIYLLQRGCWPVRIRESEEAKVGDFEVSEKGGWCSTWSEGEEVEIVIVDDYWNGGQSDERTCHGWLEDLDADND